MNTAIRILLTALQFIAPWLLVMAIIFLDFLWFGEGASATVANKKYRYVWLTAYAAIGLAHVVFFFRYLRPWPVWLRIFLTSALAAGYGYYIVQF